MRSRLALVGTEVAVEMHHEKSNLSRKANPVLFTWSDSGVLIPTDARTAQAGAEAARTVIAAEDAEHIARAVRAACGAGITVPVATRGSQTTQRVLASFPEFPEYLKGDRFARALTQTVRQLLIAEQEFRDEHRHQKRRFVPSESAAAIPPIPPCEKPPQWGAAAIRGNYELPQTAAQLPQTAAASQPDGEIEL